MTSHVRGGRTGHQRLILEDEKEEVDELVLQIGPAVYSLESVGDTDLDSPSGSDNSPVKDDPPYYGKLWGLMTKERMAQIILRYRVPSYAGSLVIPSVFSVPAL